MFVSMSSSASLVKGAHDGELIESIALYVPMNDAARPAPPSKVPSISVNTFVVALKISPSRKFILPSSALLEINSLATLLGRQGCRNHLGKSFHNQVLRQQAIQMHLLIYWINCSSVC